MALFDRVSKGTGFYPSGTAAIVDARDVAKALVLGVDKAPTGERFLLVGGHLKYKELFAGIARQAGVSAPKSQVPRWVLALAWRIESVRNFFFKSQPLVTRYTVHSACSDYNYDNTKARTVLGMEFIGVRDSIENAMAFRKR